MILGDLWVAGDKIWYSERIVKEIIDLCKNAKETSENNSLVNDILNLLDYKNSKGE